MAELLPFLVIIIAFWFLLIRPQQKRAQKAREMQNSVEVGAKVVLTSGIYGEVAGVTDDYLLISIAEGVEVRVVRNAIGQVLPAEAAIGAPVTTDDGSEEGLDPAASESAPTAVDLDKSSAPETPEETLERLRQQGENH